MIISKLRAFAYTATIMFLPLLEKESLATDFQRIDIDYKIEIGHSLTIEKELSNARKPVVIYFNSNGGHSLEAIRIGKLVRKYGASTYIPPNAECISACFLAFIGGETRTISPSARIGGHQSFWQAGTEPALPIAVSAAQNIASKALLHVIDMGVDPEAYALALSTPPDRMYLFSSDEQRHYSITGTLSGKMVTRKAAKTPNTLN